MNPKVKKILEELRQGLNALYGDRLVKLVLFGSQARGDAQEESDIDILAVFKGSFNRSQEKERVMDLTAPLSLENDTVINPADKYLNTTVVTC